ncbi:MAG: folylpolyglutamate synthase/dihydrofolate synthase family protein [Phormidesmis sp.]
MNSSESRQQTLQQMVEARLQAYARFGVDLGLERIETLLAAMGNPHQQVPIIHVAGTNGKGSVCAYLASVLTAAGYRCGRYTSPHLIDWRERICINGELISWTALQASLDRVEAAIDSASGPVPTQFEVFTAAAWQYFAQQQVDVAVVEVGLGGRLDATNVCASPLATVIVSIGRDHWQRLGDTLAKIAAEKAGILKPGVSAIAGPLPPEAKAVVIEKAAALNVPLSWVTPAKAIDGDLIFDGVRYPQVLLGDHQRINSACAIATLQTLRAQGWQISPEAIVNGMAQVRWPGRLQRGQWQGHKLLIDGAHNVAAARSLRAYLDQTLPHQPITWLMGLLQTKDHQGVFKALLRAGDRLHLVPVPGHISAEPAALRAIAQNTCPNLAIIETHTSLKTGLVAATASDLTVLCGSLYLIGSFFDTDFDTGFIPL